MASIMGQKQSTIFATGKTQRLLVFFWLIIVIIGLPTASSFTCYCEGSYCDTNHQNSTCETRQKGYCFSAAEEVWDDSQKKLVLAYSFGCLPPGIQGYMQCKGYTLPHFKINSIYCCRENLCNKEVVPVPKVTPTAALEPVPAPTPGLFKNNALTILAAIILIFWAMVILFFVFSFICYKLRSRKSCLMVKVGSTDLGKKNVVSEVPIFFLENNGKTIALPHIHVYSDNKIRY